MPFSRCQRESAAGMNPEESEVDPLGLASRSRINTSAPCSEAARAAVKPQAPAPTISNGT